MNSINNTEPAQKLNIHGTIYTKLDYFYKYNKIPHIIFHGSSDVRPKAFAVKHNQIPNF